MNYYLFISLIVILAVNFSAVEITAETQFGRQDNTDRLGDLIAKLTNGMSTLSFDGDSGPGKVISMVMGFVKSISQNGTNTKYGKSIEQGINLGASMLGMVYNMLSMNGNSSPEEKLALQALERIVQFLKGKLCLVEFIDDFVPNLIIFLSNFSGPLWEKIMPLLETFGLKF